MTELDTLKALLDERGIERGELTLFGEVIPSGVTWQGDMCEWAAIYSDGDGLVLAVYRDFLTARQAIDATIGRGECRMAQIDKDCDTASEYMLDRFFVFDEVYKCSCGAKFGHSAKDRPRFCPSCGAKVVGE